MNPTSLKTNSLLLGAALAGLAGIASEAEAATVFTETTDFSENTATPTDLSSTWSNFVTEGGIAGKIVPGSSDNTDYILLSGPANTLVSLPYSVTSTTANPYFGLNVFNGTNYVAGSYITSSPTPGQTYTGVLNFTVPANGKFTIGTSNEGAGGSTLNYTIGAVVPEAGTSVLGLAGLAAAALRRRRKDS